MKDGTIAALKVEPDKVKAEACEIAVLASLDAGRAQVRRLTLTRTLARTRTRSFTLTRTLTLTARRRCPSMAAIMTATCARP